MIITASRVDAINIDSYRQDNIKEQTSNKYVNNEKNISSECHSVCQNMSGDSLLKCAENYCSSQKNITNKEEKEDCILKSCNYTYTELSCPSNSIIEGDDTTCAATTSSSKTSCEIVNKEYYSYKVECNTNSTIKYPTNFPMVLFSGEGFEYQVAMYGNKSCTVTFDDALWKFNYASSYNDAERTNYINAINEYNHLSLSNYYYDSANANISLRIDEKRSEVHKTTKNLVSGEKYYDGNRDVSISTTSKTVTSYHDNDSVSQNVNIYKTDSSNGSYYNLPGVCISPIDNASVKEGSICQNGLGPYNQYFTDIKADTATNKIITNVEHNVSGLHVDNTCHYSVNDGDDELACYISIGTNSNQTGNILLDSEDINFYLYAITEKKDKVLRYNLGLKPKNIDDSFDNNTYYRLKRNSIKDVTTMTIYGTVTDGKDIVYCQKEVTIIPEKDDSCTFVKTLNDENGTMTLTIADIKDKNAKYYIKNVTSDTWLEMKKRTINSDDNISIIGKVETGSDVRYCYFKNNSSNETCTNMYKPAEYTKIRNYCHSNWQNDSSSFSSYDDCFNSCTANNQCKIKNNCQNKTEIRQYCQVNYQVDGYNSQSDCINDCSCSPNGIKYYYRTISISNPFPDRDANYNWFGYEKYITDDSSDEISNTNDEQEYVIVLDSKRINKIRSDTSKYNSKNKNNDAYTDYVREKDDDIGEYRSKFIHTDDVDDGGFYSYFTFVKDQE